MRRGVKGRAFLLDYFGREVPLRRDGDGDDIFSQICRATGEDGQVLSDSEIVDHMNFLMMAAHDTVTSSITSMVDLLARNPEWEARLRDEMLGLGLNGDALPYDRIDELVLTDQAFRETMRLMPPVPSIPRRALRDFSFGGHDFPAGTFVTVGVAFTHMMPEFWPEPERFDPTRFAPEQVRGRHKFAWVPFGGGAHMCLGLHFAHLQARTFFYHLLTTHRIVRTTKAQTRWQYWPIPKPRDGLPIRFERLD
jgi:cytochrome P450